MSKISIVEISGGRAHDGAKILKNYSETILRTLIGLEDWKLEKSVILEKIKPVWCIEVDSLKGEIAYIL